LGFEPHGSVRHLRSRRTLSSVSNNLRSLGALGVLAVKISRRTALPGDAT
jgi:hypothetical protein